MDSCHLEIQPRKQPFIQQEEEAKNVDVSKQDPQLVYNRIHNTVQINGHYTLSNSAFSDAVNGILGHRSQSKNKLYII